MTAKLSPEDLFSLEEYARIRSEFRARVLAHKKHRRLALGDHLMLHFEDSLTMQYQVQEMLRIERIFEPEGIQDELDAYNPLIPDGSNWKATMLIEYTDVAERQQALGQFIGIEEQVWVQANGHARVHAIADEDMERSTDEKTSAVHFLRFELSPDMIDSLRGGETLTAGVSHANYLLDGLQVPDLVRESLLADLD
ncbi:MAG: DUF3501 family protein [Gammaproteobacteria bacterium]|jgi:hypothetical protein|nr:DUF3501 family protein [Gammaproteobacteria bacterium]MDP6616343.1 DUF3501 family protein [Gammaproteobacteria bacterium]MDP6695901.1 DUF3501 family protein [Gammaproteobacteria bacterium]